MRSAGLGFALFLLALAPKPADADGFFSTLLNSAHRTPSGIAVNRSDALDARLGIREQRDGTATPEDGTVTLKFGEADVSIAAKDSLAPKFRTSRHRIGGLPRSPFLNLSGFGVMTRHNASGIDIASAFVMAQEGERLAASELAVETGETSVLIQGGFQTDPRDERNFTDGAFGGAAFEGVVGSVDYSVRWHASLNGGTGALSVKYGGASVGLARDFGAGILSPTPMVTARWRHDLQIGGLDFHLNGKPGEQAAATRLNWSLEW